MTSCRETLFLLAINASPTMTRALSKDEALAAPSGRADDFRWPRGVLNVEPAGADTAPPDAGAKSARPDSANRQWMLTPLKRAGSRSRPSAGHGPVR
jgi:hypothetical protein